MYRLALLTRAVDERLWILTRQGRAGFVLTARGHEIAQIASAVAMRVGVDSAWLYYRDLGVGLALGVTPYELFLGALARADDPHSGGRQLTAHLSSPELRIGSVSSAVGAHVPHAVGAAYASVVKGEDSVAMCWFGDGAASEGAVHEAMNLAGVHKLPVVFLCENNGYAISVPLAQQMPITSLEERALGLRLRGRVGRRLRRRGRVRRVDRGDRPRSSRRRADAASTCGCRASPRTPRRTTTRTATPSRRRRPRASIRSRGCAPGSSSSARSTPRRTRSRARRSRPRCSPPSDEAFRQPEPDGARARRWLYADG